MAQILSATKLNPFVTKETNVLKGKGTVVENLSEYAARLCYNSLGKMGHAPNFLSKRIDEGHMDVFEHASASINFDEDEKILLPYNHSSVVSDNTLRYYTELGVLDDRSTVITANLRVWREMLGKDYIKEATLPLQFLAPQIFGEEANRRKRKLYNGFYLDKVLVVDTPIAPVILNGTKVTLFGYNIVKDFLFQHHNYITFLVENISRSCSHQLVRHRRGSFSQMSQRYVDQKNAKWEFIYPLSILNDNDERTKQVFWETMQDVRKGYERLRELGIRKEDARFVLPNATPTKLMVTMSQEDWRHFIEQRALDKAAQWEIRSVGISILGLLFAIYPDGFREEWSYLNDNRERLIS